MNTYGRFLKIPAHRQPPNHYDLLDLPEDESGKAAIEEAFEKRYDHVRRHSLAHTDEVTRVLNALSDARNCLIDPERRAAYDDQRISRLVAYWLKSDSQPVDFYQLIDVRPFTADREYLQACLSAAAQHLSDFERHRSTAQRAAWMKTELNRARSALSDRNAYREYHQGLLLRLRAEYGKHHGTDSASWCPEELLGWLREHARVHPRRVESVARCLRGQPSDACQDLFEDLFGPDVSRQRLPSKAPPRQLRCPYCGSEMPSSVSGLLAHSCPEHRRRLRELSAKEDTVGSRKGTAPPLGPVVIAVILAVVVIPLLHTMTVKSLGTAVGFCASAVGLYFVAAPFVLGLTLRLWADEVPDSDTAAHFTILTGIVHSVTAVLIGIVWFAGPTRATSWGLASGIFAAPIVLLATGWLLAFWAEYMRHLGIGMAKGLGILAAHQVFTGLAVLCFLALMLALPHLPAALRGTILDRRSHTAEESPESADLSGIWLTPNSERLRLADHGTIVTVQAIDTPSGLRSFDGQWTRRGRQLDGLFTVLLLNDRAPVPRTVSVSARVHDTDTIRVEWSTAKWKTKNALKGKELHLGGDWLRQE